MCIYFEINSHCFLNAEKVLAWLNNLAGFQRSRYGLCGIIDFSGTVDLINQEKNRLLKEEAACAKEVEFYKSKLSNDEFLKKAPAHVLEKQRAKLNAAIEKLEKTKKSLAELHCSE